MTARAVPVKYSARMFWAQLTTPCSVSQLATNKMLLIRRIVPMIPSIMIFRIVRVMSIPFKLRFITSIQISANLERRKFFLKET